MKNDFIEDQWIRFQNVFLSKEKDPETINYCVLSFYTGAIAVYSLLKPWAEDFSEGEGPELWHSVQREIEAFILKINKLNSEHPGGRRTGDEPEGVHAYN